MNTKHTTLALALLALSSTAAANTPTCASTASDNDNDGWGWENSASCIVATASSTQPATIFAAVQTASTGQPVCTSPNADPDGDGWGWENDASCLVSSTPASESVSTPGSEPSSSNTTYCSSADSDEDGDGWGWENNSSCVVAPASVDTADTSDSVSEVTNSGTAQCSFAISDEDGDGWGWENNQSCIVVTATSDNTETDTPEVDTSEPEEPTILPPCSVPALDDNNDGIGQENNQDCSVDTPVEVRIMALGDSITHGSSRALAESYRKPFNQLMTSNECQFEMVGSQSGNYLHETYVSPHEGYNAHTADHILNGFVNNAGNNEGISVTSNRYQPHVVLLHIGSNDMKLGQDIDQTVGEIDQIISVILATDSAPVVLLANVIPWLANANIDANVKVLGDSIEAYVTQLNSPRVRIVDVRSGYTSSMMLSDDIHPNPAGEQHIAERFFAAYNSAGFCR